MTRFLGMAVFLTIAFGLALHGGLELPQALDWVGSLPGDMVVKKGSLSVYVPIGSSLLISAVVSFFLSMLSSKPK